jgi:hypothetical protein
MRLREEPASTYRFIPSPGEYLLLAQDHVIIEHYTRGDDGDTWQLRTFRNRHGTLVLAAVHATLSIGSIYRRIPAPGAALGGV